MRIRMSIFASNLLLCTIVANCAHAAATIGVRAGVSIAQASLSAQQNFEAANRTGFTGTLFMDMGLGVINLQPEVSYTQKGAKNATTGEKIALNYVELAALLKLGLPLPVIQPHIFAGIGADFNMDTSVTFANGSLTTKNVDWTIPLGVDLKLAFGKLAIFGDARYAVGLANVNQGSAVVKDLKNRAWILSAGIGTEF